MVAVRLAACDDGEPMKTFGLRPESLPLIRACSLPTSVFGPVDLPPCSLHLPLRAVSSRLQGVPVLVLAPHGVGTVLALLGNGRLTVAAPCLHGVWVMVMWLVNLC